MAMKTEGLSSTNKLLVACVFVAAWNSACTNHGSFGGNNGLKPQTKHASPTPSSSVNPSTGSIDGNWLCIDNRCEANTVKLISDNGTSIETTSTKRSLDAKLICRVQETAKLIGRTGSSTESISGGLVHSKIRLLASPENTQNCSELSSENSAETLNSEEPVSIDYDSENDQIKVNGVVYRRFSDEEFKETEAKQVEADAAMNSIAGDWMSVDKNAASEELHQMISTDLKVMTTTSLVSLPTEDQVCHIQEVSSFEVVDNTDPNKIYATQIHGLTSLVSDPRNTQKCVEIVQIFNQGTGSSAPIHLVLERDGNLKLTIQEQSNEVNGGFTREFVRNRQS